MKSSSPFKTLRSSPLFANGGVQIPTQPHKGEGTDSKVGRKKQSEIEYRKSGDEFETVASFAPVAGEIIDAKNTVKDLINEDYGGAALNAAGFALPFVSGKALKGLFRSGKKTTKADVGGVGKKWSNKTTQPGFSDHGKISYDEAMELLDNTKAQGKRLDDIGYDVSKQLDNRNIKFHGTSPTGQSIAEVALPDGETAMFYLSTDQSGKGVEGAWQVYAGNADVPGHPGWYIKDEGYRSFYDSESFADIAGQLNRVAAEEGWDMSKQILKSKMK